MSPAKRLAWKKTTIGAGESMEEDSREEAIRKLWDIVESRYIVKVQKINAERDARYRGLSRRRCACMGRAARRLEILKEFASRKVRVQIKIYENVAKKYRCDDMLSTERLDRLREEIATSAKLECQSIKEMSERDCHAAGEWDQSAIEALARHYPVIAGHIEGVANTELRVLKAEAAARALRVRTRITGDGRATETKKKLKPIAAVGSKQRRTHMAAKPTRPMKKSRHTNRKVKIHTPLGSNINRLRKECGWTYDDLENRTGIDKTLIIGHVNHGKGAHPSTLKTYADAFTRELKRTITVTDLEG
jgi:hypothetical protein